ncbi:prealbumin-like fold domain-containing protein [Agrococcus baldri]|uniref:prealbumin-like fold domain-containing protein n=1 Tax=Agrococcus baldri TaxID=153730 RepID=UPI001160C6E5|nr:hypothetical protein [Agrococcus baldri]
MAVNSAETGVDPPYLHWRVSPTQAGTTFEIEQQIVERRWIIIWPRWVEQGWTSTTTITDCVVAGQCSPTGDLDPDPGEFQVAYVGSANRVQADTSNRRHEYRVRPVGEPAGTFWESTEWRYSRYGDRPNGIGDLETFHLGTYPAASCVSGTIYALSSAGVVTQISRPSGHGDAVLSRFDTIPQVSGGGGLNALGIGPGGTSMFVAERTGNAYGVQAIHTYSVASGWQRVTFSAVASGTVVVGGATNLMDGRYYFGGYRQVGNSTFFDVWVFDPQSNARPVLRGTVSVPLNATSNGDIAFDAAGNLFMLQNQQSTATTRIYTIPASILTAGDAMVAQTVSSFTGIRDVNGFAFEADGHSYLSNGTDVRIYDPSSGLQPGAVTTELSGTVDLAGCLSPVTLTVRKDVVSRFASSDQFTLTVARGSTTLGSVRTTGNQSGVQQEQVGPITVASGQAYSIRESVLANGDRYSSTYTCVDERGTVIASGEGRFDTITMPPRGGASVVCTFRNAPLIAGVVVRKIVEDTSGVQRPDDGWILAAASTATAGTVTASPVAGQVSDANGEVSWVLNFGSASARALVAISEVQQPGFEFASGSCVVTTAAGVTNTVTLNAAQGTQDDVVAGIAPGWSVECEITNRVLPTTLALVKSISFGDSTLASAWQLSAIAVDGAAALPGPSGSSGVSAPISPGATYELAEDAGLATYIADPTIGWFCETTNGTRIEVVNDRVVVPTAGLNVVCTVTNTTARLSLLKLVENDLGGGLDASAFELSATPFALAAGTLPVLADIPGSASVSRDNTMYVRPGHRYTLTEDMGDYAYLGTELQRWDGEPAQVDHASPHWTTVDEVVTVEAGDHAIYRFVNRPAPALALPLTGGIGADTYLFGGAGVLLLGLLTAAVLFAQTRIRSSRKGS